MLGPAQPVMLDLRRSERPREGEAVRDGHDVEPLETAFFVRRFRMMRGRGGPGEDLRLPLQRAADQRDSAQPPTPILPMPRMAARQGVHRQPDDMVDAER